MPNQETTIPETQIPEPRSTQSFPIVELLEVKGDPKTDGTPEQQAAYNKALAKVNNLLRHPISWQNIKPYLTEISEQITTNQYNSLMNLANNEMYILD